VASVSSQTASGPSARRVVMLLLWLSPVIVLVALAYYRYFSGLTQPVAADYAQLARHLARGDGQVTSVIRPVELARFATLAHHPDLYRAPLFTWLLALVFRVFGASDGAAAATTVALFFASVAVTYGLGIVLAGRRTAVLATVLVALSPSYLRSSVEGVPVALGAALLALAVYLTLRLGDHRWGPLIVGAVTGLTALASYHALLAAVPLVIWVARSRPRHLRAGGLFLAGMVIVGLPWLIRNTVVAHNPVYSSSIYDLAAGTGDAPGTTLLRTYAATPPASPFGVLSGLSAHAIGGKLLRGWRALYTEAPAQLGLVVVALFIAALALAFQREAARQARAWIALALLLACLAAPLGLPGAPFLLLFVPLIAVYAAAAFWALTSGWRDRPRLRAEAVAVLLLFAGGPLLISLVLPRADGATSRSVRELSRALPRGAVVVTDVPWLIAWQADRTAIWLPVDIDNFEALDRRFPADHIFLSSHVGTDPPEEMMGNWRPFYMLPPPAPWEITHYWEPAAGWHEVLIERSRQ
jgi:4-amino-4-deoxy-L-arabinose transferase-like glycosyltransferase